MKIAIIGAGYVGLSIAACLADIGHKVICYDCDSDKLNNIIKGNIPIYEPDLNEIILKNINKSNLKFTTEAKVAIKDADICFIAVGTPTLNDGVVDESAVDSAIETIAKNITKYTVIVNKSTVPIGRAQKTTETIKKLTNQEFDVVSNPEFLRQGSAVCDFLNPERIVIGTKSKRAADIMLKLYEPLNLPKEKIILTDEKSAEMIKYASNAFLAVKISYINELAELCENIGADIDSVAFGMGLDSRIGSKFLKSGIGFGGSCFPKDTKAIVNIAKNYNSKLVIIESAIAANERTKSNFVEKILSYFKNDIKNKKFALWGLSFKPNTNDTREAPSIYVIKSLLENGAKISAYDPKAEDNIKKIFKNEIEYAKSKEEALYNADGLIILTEWDEFINADFALIKKMLNNSVVFDGINIFKKNELNKYDLTYICIGKPWKIK